jgi:hypothetical protein
LGPVFPVFYTVQTLIMCRYLRPFTSLLLFSLLCVAGPACRDSGGQSNANSVRSGSNAAFVKGAYGNPAALWEQGYRFDSLGLNAVFVRSQSLSRDFLTRARSEGVKVYMEFPTLNGKAWLKTHPEATPITAGGVPAQAADWFMGICPTDSAFRRHRKEELAGLLDSLAVDGVFLDYFHWHAQFESEHPILPETCFCDRCLHLFEGWSGQEPIGENTAEKAAWILKNQDAAWRRWRANVLLDWAVDLRHQVRRINPDLVVGVYHCGWFPADHDSALYRILGIDLPTLAREVDALSPMLFHQLKNRPTAWVGEYMNWLDQQPWMKTDTVSRIWPIVQAYNNPGIISAEEFAEVLKYGSGTPSTGLMFFSAEAIATDSIKLNVLKEFYWKIR